MGFQIVQLRTAHGHGMVTKHLRMEIRVRRCSTVGQEDQIRSLEKSGIRTEKLQLDRPVPEFGYRLMIPIV